MSVATPNYGWILPAVNDPVDANAWGTELNGNISDQDTIVKAVSDTADNALATAIAGSAEPGDICYSWKTSKSGWVIAQGSIGSAASGATNRANADTVNLYTALWNNVIDTWAPVSGGRGLTAAADFAANKPLTVPDGRDVVLAGVGNMGGVDAALLTNAISGLDGTVLGRRGGDQRMQTHTHVQDAHHHFVPTGGSAGSGIRGDAQGSSFGANTNDTTATNQNTGAGSSQNVQPTMMANMFYKL